MVIEVGRVCSPAAESTDTLHIRNTHATIEKQNKNSESERTPSIFAGGPFAFLEE